MPRWGTIFFKGHLGTNFRLFISRVDFIFRKTTYLSQDDPLYIGTQGGWLFVLYKFMTATVKPWFLQRTTGPKRHGHFTQIRTAFGLVPKFFLSQGNTRIKGMLCQIRQPLVFYDRASDHHHIQYVTQRDPKCYPKTTKGVIFCAGLFLPHVGRHFFRPHEKLLGRYELRFELIF